MKKGSYYFGLLNEEEKENYKNNILTNLRFNFLMEETFESFANFISKSFYWMHTPQGHTYWQNIANSNRENIEG